MRHYRLQCGRGRELILADEPVVMGILNVTPDSFSDGGAYGDAGRASERGLEMFEQGAGIVDIGGESTRPGAEAVSASEQIRRIVPVIERIRESSEGFVSVDTTLAEVADAALGAGADIINDVAALRFDERLVEVAAASGAPVVLMHMQGKPGDMQVRPSYDNVVEEVKGFLRERIAFAVERGVAREQIIVDVGIGFGKTVEHNLQLMRGLGEFEELGCGVLVGSSRKSFIGKVLGVDEPRERIWGTAATVAQAVLAGAHIVRVHDVGEMVQVARMSAALRDGRG